MTSPLLKKARALIRWMWISFLYASGLLWWAKRRLAGEGVVVLTFHRVLPDTDFRRTNSPTGMAVREQTFAQLAEYLARRCVAVSLSEDGPEWTVRAGKPRVALTFDDGWADNATSAFPIARTQGLPWTIFICPECMGRHLPYWPERVVALWRAAESRQATSRLLQVLAIGANSELPAARQPGEVQTAEAVIDRLKEFSPEERNLAIRRMTEAVDASGNDEVELGGSIDATMQWREIEALASRGVTFGSHTLSHLILTRAPFSEAQREIAGSKLAIEQKLRRDCRLFAYPNGDWSAEVRDLVAQAGYQLAFANRPGVWTRATDRFAIPRINVWEGSLVGPAGRFSPIAFEYAVFWQAFRAGKARSAVSEEVKPLLQNLAEAKEFPARLRQNL